MKGEFVDWLKGTKSLPLYVGVLEQTHVQHEEGSSHLHKGLASAMIKECLRTREKWIIARPL